MGEPANIGKRPVASSFESRSSSISFQSSYDYTIDNDGFSGLSPIIRILGLFEVLVHDVARPVVATFDIERFVVRTGPQSRLVAPDILSNRRQTG